MKWEGKARVKHASVYTEETVPRSPEAKYTDVCAKSPRSRRINGVETNEFSITRRHPTGGKL